MHHLNRPAGRSLIAGAVMLFITMGLHPAGGSLERIVAIYTLIVFVHALAILSLPVLALGFWGLSNWLMTRNGLSLLAFFVMGFGLVAAMLAALFNGLVLPMYAMRHVSDTGVDLATIKLVVHYDLIINRCLDYVFITAVAIAMGIWSGLMLQTGRLPRWLGYWGLLLVGMIMIGALTNFDFIGVAGFRAFVFGLACWIVLVGYFLSRVIHSESSKLLHTNG